MAVGKGSINRVSKAVDEKVVAPAEKTPTKTTPAKTTAKKTTAKKTTAKKTVATQKVVTKPSAQVEKVIGKKDVHYGVGSTLPTFLM